MTFSLLSVLIEDSLVSAFSQTTPQANFHSISWECDNPFLKLIMCNTGGPNNNNNNGSSGEDVKNDPKGNKMSTDTSPPKPEEIYDKVKGSVVTIYSEGEMGTGFLWDAQGHIVTARHVIEGENKFLVTFKNSEDNGFERTYQARYVGSDFFSDLAVLQIESNWPLFLSPLHVASTDELHVGDKVYAIGNPLGISSNAFTSGMVNNFLPKQIMGNELDYNPSLYPVGDMSDYAFIHFIQFDAPITSGNSGGPVLNENGDVVGMVDAESAKADYIQVAVPSKVLNAVVPNLIYKGKYYHAWLGFDGVTLNGGGGCQINNIDVRSQLVSLMGKKPSMFGQNPSVPAYSLNNHAVTIHAIDIRWDNDTLGGTISSNGNIGSPWQSYSNRHYINTCEDIFDSVQQFQYNSGGKLGMSVTLYLSPQSSIHGSNTSEEQITIHPDYFWLT